MDVPLRVLLVEDSEDDALLLLRELRRGGYQPTFERVDTEEGLAGAIAGGEWDLAIIDYTMPTFNGMAALEILKASGSDIPLMILSSTIGEEIAVDAMRKGAHDYLMKSNMARLLPALERELREARMREERRRVLAIARHQANHDPVTQLPNRLLFQDRFHQAIWTASLHDKPASLTLVDLHGFTALNESVGHLKADLLLGVIAGKIRGALPDVFTVARFGNDEFAIVQPGATSEDSVRETARILELIREPLDLDGGRIAVDAAAGIATYPDHGVDSELLIQHAMFALSAAKLSRSDFAVFDPSHKSDRRPEMELVAELRSALNTAPDQFFMAFQPKVRLDTGEPCGVEALVRWRHPRLGVLPPDEFIPLAESSGLIRQLTSTVVRHTAKEVASWSRNGLGKPVAINLSAFDLDDPGIGERIMSCLTGEGIDPSAIELEVTEGSMMRAPIEAMRSLLALREMGIGVSIDDFGVGYSSFAYLKDLPASTIKVDKSFVAGMAHAPADTAIVRSIIDLGHNLGFEVIAEGVEEYDAWMMLREMGCDIAQGFLIARPMRGAELPSWQRGWTGEPERPKVHRPSVFGGA